MNSIFPVVAAALSILGCCAVVPSTAWVSTTPRPVHLSRVEPLSSTAQQGNKGSVHGQNSCFLPLKQLDQDYLAPRIVQIAGAYPGLSTSEFYAVQSEASPEPGQWTYDFSDPDGPQLGTVAIEGSGPVASCEDPVAIIAEHPSLGVPMPDVITDPVDLIVLVDRAQTTYVERKFLVLTVPEMGDELLIGAYPTKADLPQGAEIRGHVVYTQIPWLPSMKPTKSGFMEIDEYF
eukprot:CAMPEP_0113474046 /NCGR_PEP_ID=MMETSP0014_2-20120614/18372_1 /TAXON_ID=2857 /ORGANISM="Nitzschia sp." /LENGTH=232 /DNA_ID=CAMNT_0000366861 /DNA_START=85 /DNA_END=783 /DNA_ORIENTATION=- /assembly_acc=CAM_ASM_000159